MKVFWNKLLTFGHKIIAKFITTFLIFFLFVQILFLSWMVKAVMIENLLFSENITSTQQEFTFFNANSDTLKQLLISSDMKDKDDISRYYTQLFLITIVVGLIIRYLTFLGKENQPDIPFYIRFWLVINFLLFATQIFLLPVNYGVLLLNNKYQEVKVQFISRDEKDSMPEDKKLPEVKNHPPKSLNKIRDQQLELYGSPFKYDLEASPQIFFEPDVNVLRYTAKSDKPDVVQIEIVKNFLLVNPHQKGEVQITVEAWKSESTMASTSFKVHVKDEINTMGAKEANPIPQQKLVVGEKPFTKDLIVEPSVFSLLDNDPVHLTFQAYSSESDVASVNINENILTVKPISKGSSEIAVIANDGYGRMINSMFEVTVLGQTLEWPVDESLLLLYQSNDVFYLYSKQEKRIWRVRSGDIESMVFYGLVGIFNYN